jgi:hypothetical protein
MRDSKNRKRLTEQDFIKTFRKDDCTIGWNNALVVMVLIPLRFEVLKDRGK